MSLKGKSKEAVNGRYDEPESTELKNSCSEQSSIWKLRGVAEKEEKEKEELPNHWEDDAEEAEEARRGAKIGAV